MARTSAGAGLAIAFLFALSPLAGCLAASPQAPASPSETPPGPALPMLTKTFRIDSGDRTGDIALRLRLSFPQLVQCELDAIVVPTGRTAGPYAFAIVEAPWGAFVLSTTNGFSHHVHIGSLDTRQEPTETFPLAPRLLQDLDLEGPFTFTMGGLDLEPWHRLNGSVHAPVRFELECDEPFEVTEIAWASEVVLADQTTLSDGQSASATAGAGIVGGGPQASAVVSEALRFETQKPRVWFMGDNADGRGTARIHHPKGEDVWTFPDQRSFQVEGGAGSYKVVVDRLGGVADEPTQPGYDGFFLVFLGFDTGP